MKARFFILASALFLLVLSLHGQQENTLYVSQFRGVTVGDKVAAAQAACNPNPALPCVVVIDPPLAGFAMGTLPSLGRNVVLQDMRGGSASPSDWHDLTASCRAYRPTRAPRKKKGIPEASVRRITPQSRGRP
jgi:hypothetical protein